MRRLPFVSACMLLGLALPAQELLWQLQPTASARVAYGPSARSFGDYDRDGCDDLLLGTLVNPGSVVPPPIPTVRILSGRDGAVLYEQPPFYGAVNLTGIGDLDFDGYPDYAFAWAVGGGAPGSAGVDVWSPRQNRRLHRLLAPVLGAAYGGSIAGRLDFTGDGLPDLLVASTDYNGSVLYAYDNTGTLRYSRDALPYGAVIHYDAVAAVGDLDGDRCDDYVIGLFDFAHLGRGALALISGRTGSVLRLHLGPQPLDTIGTEVVAAGDVDRDGFTDYATGVYNTYFRSQVLVYSGATGAVLRSWVEPVPPHTLGNKLIGGHDVDLDGMPDMIVGCAAYPNFPPGTPYGTWLWGRVRALSSRDGQDLVWTRPYDWTDLYGWWIADLGVQPGNPYPVIAVLEVSALASASGRVGVFRLSPPGTSGPQVTGTGCSSAGAIPTIGIRRVTSPSGEGSRIVLGSAPPGALAWCLAAPVDPPFDTEPVPLAPFGLPGCELLLPPVFFAARTVGTTGMDRGYAAVDLPWPLGGSPTFQVVPPPITGRTHAAQWLILDPASGAFAMTPRHTFRLR